MYEQTCNTDVLTMLNQSESALNTAVLCAGLPSKPIISDDESLNWTESITNQPSVPNFNLCCTCLNTSVYTDSQCGLIWTVQVSCRGFQGLRWRSRKHFGSHSDQCFSSGWEHNVLDVQHECNYLGCVFVLKVKIFPTFWRKFQSRTVCQC